MARALSRLALGRGGPRDLGALRDGLAVGAAIARRMAEAEDPLSPPPTELAQALAALDPRRQDGLTAFQAALAAGLDPDLPAQARDGGFVAAGVSAELDETRALRDDSRRVIAGAGGAAGRRERGGR